MTAPTRTATTTEITFTAALPAGVTAEPGIGYLQPSGLVVHTGWSLPHGRPPTERMWRQHEDYDDAQGRNISTPDGYSASRFAHLTWERAEAAAAVIAAALPGGTWPAHTIGNDALRQRALDASSTPELLPRTRNGRPDWGKGCVTTHWTMPDTRTQYEQVVPSHGLAPANCRTCTDIKRHCRGTVWLPRTRHWPVWNPSVHQRGSLCHAHCMCLMCIGPPAIGTLGTTDHKGQSVPATRSASTLTPIRDAQGHDVPHNERGFAWFSQLLIEGGCVIIDNRPCEGLWRHGVRHGDAFFSETGLAPGQEP